MSRHSHVILLIGLTIAQTGLAQNLVPNGDFEIYSVLPDSLAQINRAIGWNNVNGSYGNSPKASPDYYHVFGTVTTALGAMTPASGYGQAAFATFHYYFEYREYISTQLTTPLIPGQPYSLSYYLSTGGNSVINARTNNIGVHLSTAPLFQNVLEVINAVPQFELPSIIELDGIWRKYTFNFIAQSAYAYITIGNFRTDAQTTVINSNSEAYYFIDNISLTPGFSPLQITGDQSICQGSSLQLKAINGTDYSWATAQNPLQIFSHADSVIVNPATTTTYFLYSNSDTTSFTVQVMPIPVINLGQDTSVCGNAPLTLQAQTAMSYLWSTGASTPSIQVNTSGQYWVQASNGNCARRDTIQVQFQPYPLISLGPDTSLCTGQVLDLTAGTAGTYLWSTGVTTSSIQIGTAGTYWVLASINQCKISDTIVVSYNVFPEVNLGTDTTLCPGETILLNAGTASGYLWSNGSHSANLSVSVSGNYWVTASNGTCSVSDSIVITIPQFPDLPWISDTSMCNEETLVLDAGPADGYLWSTGAVTRTIEVNASGTYEVDIRYFNVCENSYSIKAVFTDCQCRVFMPTAFTPNNDGLNDRFKPAKMNGCEFKSFSIYNRWGQKVYESTKTGQGWDGRLNGLNLPPGVFIWMIEAEKDGKKKVFNGTVLLIR